ncbi:MAG: biotin--[acetyl-CoA-carboxylase] ligase [Oscillospiraceae bacterium]|nr:biotin--[acetyl-CoA-carboxylase] ligase [Oscillospiraceae bacterium]
MLKDNILRLLLGRSAPLSGQAMSRELGVSRAAVWKGVEALRRDGYVIASHPAKGYLLTASPDLLSPAELSRPGRAVGGEVVYLEVTDSTNNECKRRAADGASSGLVVIAGEQTGGRGRRGRSYQSLPGKGLYLSVLLRPEGSASPEVLSHFTAWVSVAVCRALEGLTGLPCGIKWTNDILLGNRKLCGILCELGLTDDRRPDYMVVGIGVNVSQTEADFGPELSAIATSLGQHMATPPTRAEAARALLGELDRLWGDFPGRQGEYLGEYRTRCLTLGKQVRLIQPDRERLATALAVNEDFSLRVRLENGTEENVSSGEVSVRGLEGYV